MRNTGVWWWLVTLCILAVPPTTRAGSVAADKLTITNVMSPDDFASCGLQKLTNDELRALNAWLNRYTVAVLTVAKEASSVTEKSTAAASRAGAAQFLAAHFNSSCESATLFALKVQYTGASDWSRTLFEFKDVRTAVEDADVSSADRANGVTKRAVLRINFSRWRMCTQGTSARDRGCGIWQASGVPMTIYLTSDRGEWSGLLDDGGWALRPYGDYPPTCGDVHDLRQ